MNTHNWPLVSWGKEGMEKKVQTTIGFRVWGLEGMEIKMETTMMDNFGTTASILHS